ncbi:MAG: site-2 protease family protein [Rhodanobacter sp.]
MKPDLAVVEQPQSVQRYRIRDGVVRVERKESIILVSPDDGTSVRMSPVAEELMTLLAQGAHFDQLATKLREKHPTALDLSPKLSGFLGQLARAGLLDNGDKAAPRSWRAPRLVVFHPDRVAALVARGIKLLPTWLTWSLLYLALFIAVLGVAGLIWAGQLPPLSGVVTEFSGWGFAIFVLLVVPLHEASHAIACRLAGAPVGVAGVVMHGWLVPGPFVETSQSYRLRERSKRFWIPAAGPVINLLATGAAAWGLLLIGPRYPDAPAILSYVFLLGAIFIYLDTNPLSPSDGSHMLEAILDDELVRRSALSKKRSRLSARKNVAIYRIACSTHLQASAVLAYFWWTM